MTLPICYTFRRCPFAIRARMAIDSAQIDVGYREVLLNNKPPQMLVASAKGTVPILVLENGEVIDESLNVIQWALDKNDPESWLITDKFLIQAYQEMIEINDGVFKTNLDRYKYADRHPQMPGTEYRHMAESFLRYLENRLKGSSYLLGKQITVADISIFPFIRQFAMVDIGWFDQSPYRNLQLWLKGLMSSERFQRIMAKNPIWEF